VAGPTRRLAVLPATVIIGAGLLAAPAPAGPLKPQRRTVAIADDYYAPAKLTVNPRSTIVWRWPEAGDTHDVKLVAAPKGVRKFQSEAAAVGYVFARRLTAPGTYLFECTFHEGEMTMTVRVRRQRR